MTKNVDILQHEINALILHTSTVNDSLKLTDYCMHFFLPLIAFLDSTLSANHLDTVLFACSAITLEAQSLENVKRIIDKVQKNVFGQSLFVDIKALLQLNGLWNKQVVNYSSHPIECCHVCRPASPRTPSRKVSLATLNYTLFRFADG